MILKQVQKEIKDGLKTYKVFQELDGVLENLVQAEEAMAEKQKLIAGLKKDIEVRKKKIKKLDEEISNKEDKCVTILDEANESAKMIVDSANKDAKKSLEKLKKEITKKEKTIKEREKKAKDLDDIIKMKESQEASASEKLNSAKAELRKLLGGE